MASLNKRGKVYHAQWYVGGKQVRRSLETASYQVAREKLRSLESKLARGEENPLPTQTPIGEIVAAYVRYIRAMKTAKSAQTDISYLRQLFGPCCPEIDNSARDASSDPASPQKRKATRKSDLAPLSADCFERITTAQVVDWISEAVRRRGLKPKTANRYREILTRVYNWAEREGRVRMPTTGNPAARVQRYREQAPEIRFLTLPQITEQFDALSGNRQLQTMVAVLIYAGLRREELLWLRGEDVDLHAKPRGIIRVRAKTIEGHRWEPKTKRNRVVPISSNLLPYLLRYRPALSRGDWYFPSPMGCRWDPDNFSQALRRSQATARLSWGCLDYRHTFGSHLAQRGISLHKIAALMGNSPEICRRHYAALVPEALSDDVEFGEPQIANRAADLMAGLAETS